MDHLDQPRSYFTVIDESGTLHPAVDYLAGTLDEQPVFEIMALKRFVKLIGSGEHLSDIGDGRFIGLRSRRTYSFRAKSAQED